MDLLGLDISLFCPYCWCSTGSDKSKAPALKTICSHLCSGLLPTVSKQQDQENTKNMLTRADCLRSLLTKKQKQKKNKEEKTCLYLPPTLWSTTPTSLSSIWITCSLLKGPSPGRSGGGDTPNEDEYSVALERLLEGCPACTRCSSQIGGTMREGGARRSGLKWGSWVEGASRDDWGGRQAREACVSVCCQAHRHT